MKALLTKVCSVAAVCMFAAGARADAPLPKKSSHGDVLKWTLKVGEKTYGMRPEGGSIPLPSELDWSCRYSRPRTKNHKNAEETVIHVTCTRSDSRFSFTPACTRSLHKGVGGEDLRANAAQSVTLYTGNQIVVVGVSCELAQEEPHG